MKRVYLDNSATSFPKPETVHEAMLGYARHVGASAGRGAYREAVESAGTIGRCRALLARLGYRVSQDREDRVVGVRRRWAPLGTFVFHGAFFLIAAGFLLTLLARQEGRVWVTVGEEFEGRPDQFLSQTPPKPLTAGVPTPRFRVEAIRPEFWARLAKN